MRDIKKQFHWDGDQNWPRCGIVQVKGQADAVALSADSDEDVIASWHHVAVLLVPEIPDGRFGFTFRVGFYVEQDGVSTMQILRYKFSSADLHSGMFGMRVGPDDVSFIVIPDIGNMSLELVEVADFSDPRYSNLPVI